MNDKCTLSCGLFEGIDPDSFQANKSHLQSLFHHIRFDQETKTLDICGAKDLEHDPDKLSRILDRLSTILAPQGKGQILLTCETTEICYFRQNMWKLMPIHIPEDPFENIHYVSK